MRNETARLLRAVLRLVENDVAELQDTVVQIDEREAAHYGELRKLQADVDLLARSMSRQFLLLEGYSVKVPPS